MSENIWCVAVQNKIFDANVLLCRNKFFPTGEHYHWFIWHHVKSNNFKHFLPPKVSERARLQIPMTLESIVSAAILDH